MNLLRIIDTNKSHSLLALNGTLIASTFDSYTPKQIKQIQTQLESSLEIKAQTHIQSLTSNHQSDIAICTAKNNIDEGMTRCVLLLDTVIQDWEVKQGSDVPLERQGKYRLRVQKSTSSDALYVSIADVNLSTVPNCYEMGLFATFEITNGTPMLSLGINSDENIWHVKSNNNNEMAMYRNCEHDDPTWTRESWVSDSWDYLSHKITHDCGLNDNRKAIAEHIFGQYDLGVVLLSRRT